MAGGDPIPHTPQHNEFTESVVDAVDRMRDEGGIAPDIPHQESTLKERGVTGHPDRPRWQDDPH